MYFRLIVDSYGLEYTEFNEELWGSMLDHITVGRGKGLTVRFKDGTEITA